MGEIGTFLNMISQQRSIEIEIPSIFLAKATFIFSWHELGFVLFQYNKGSDYMKLPGLKFYHVIV